METHYLMHSHYTFIREKVKRSPTNSCIHNIHLQERMWRGMVVIHYFMYLQHSPWMSTIYEYASLKTSSVKHSGIKPGLKKKEYIFICTWGACDTASLKYCREKLSGIKTWIQCVDLLMICSPRRDKLYFQHVTSLRWHILILYVNFLNVCQQRFCE